MSYLKNRLNDYDTYTYNLRMYMVHPNNLSRLDNAINNGQGVLIADNARVAKYNISNVEQIFTVGHTVVRETFGNRFQITISEPNGVTLLTTIANAARQLNIKNHLHAGYILVVEFNGRMKDGRPKKFDQTFYYPVTIKSLDFKVNEGGAVYNIEAIENSSNGYRYVNNVIKEQITVEAQTVGEFVDEFERKFNESILNAWAANPNAGAIPDSYRFEFDETTEAWKDWKFQVIDEPFMSDGANFSGSIEDGNFKLQITVNNGSNITAIFGQVLQLTAEYKNILVSQGSKSNDEYFRERPNERTRKTLDVFPTFFKMVSNVEYGTYDILRGEYQKIIIYKLRSYVVPDEIIDTAAYTSSITNSVVQRQRVANLMAGNFLRKKYDYYYTGKNTEVIEFDLQFDLAYYYVTPYGDGYFGDPNVQSPQIIKDRPELIGRLEDITDARQKLASASQNLRRITSTGQDTQLQNFLRNQVNNALNQLETTVNETLSFLEQEYEWSPQDINYQLRFLQDVISDQDMNTSDNDSMSGNLKFGAVKANLENAADLIKIELVIRGDPYWMGVPNSFYNSQQPFDELANYEIGSQFFYLNISFPTSDEGFDGRRKPRPDYQMSGVYRVVNVINRFQNGQFIQYLSAVRDLATNTSTIHDLLANDDTTARAAFAASFAKSRRENAQEQENAYRALGRAPIGPQ